jgi:hypothetical protein
MYKNWTLYKGNVEFENGKTLTTFFFSKRKPKKGVPCDLLEGFDVDFNQRTGLPNLNRTLQNIED